MTVAPPPAPPLPTRHSHLPEYEGIAPGCAYCMRLGLINPDTGTPWPELSEHGEQVVEDGQARFHDRYDGENQEAALADALREAYLRGHMAGQQHTREEAGRKAQNHERIAQRAAEDAAERIGQPGVEGLILRGMAEAQRHLGIAAGFREVAGRRGAL